MDLRMVVKVGTDESTVKGSTKQGGGCRMNAEKVSSLLDVAGKVAHSLVVENGAGQRRVLIGGAEEADGIELGEEGVVVKLGLIFGIDCAPTKRRDRGVDG